MLGSIVRDGRVSSEGSSVRVVVGCAVLLVVFEQMTKVLVTISAERLIPFRVAVFRNYHQYCSSFLYTLSFKHAVVA
jgi:hypothetical protein